MSPKLLRIYGKHFRLLKGLTFNHQVVDIVRCGDIHPFESGPVFEEAETIFLRNCNKNFVYYWLKPSIFPKAKNIYLSSHPCEPSVFHRTWSSDTKIHLVEFYRGYKLRWAKHQDNVLLVTPVEIEDALKEYSEIEEYGNLDEIY